MPIWLRLTIIICILFSVLSFVWFLLGATAYFQGGMDIIGTTYLWGLGIPVLIFATLFSRLLVKGWTSTSGLDYVGIFLGLILAILISTTLILSVQFHGWAKQKISSDTIKITDDGIYEYRIELINLFQRNSRAQLYLREVETGEETYIPVNIQTREIKLSARQVKLWGKLEPTDEPLLYILSTNKTLGLPVEKFEINIETKTSSRLERF